VYSCVEGVAYTFGHDGGLIVYSFPDYELPDARRDEMAVGIVTSQRSAIVLRVVSGSSSDFIEMELVCTQYQLPSISFFMGWIAHLILSTIMRCRNTIIIIVIINYHHRRCHCDQETAEIDKKVVMCLLSTRYLRTILGVS